MRDSAPELAELLPSWQLALRSQRKSPATVKSYTEGVIGFLRWCESTQTPAAVTKSAVQSYVVALLDSGQSAKTASARLIALKRFSAWMAEEGEIAVDAVAGLKQPKIDNKVVEALSEDQLRNLVKACQGKRFVDRRDEAIVRLMAETGMRAAEVTGLQTTDVDQHRGIVTIRRGKGGRGRIVAFGPQTGEAIDRYLRLRRPHKLAGTDKLWLGADNWRDFNYFGLRHALQRRAESAGIDGFHLHKMRHTAATRWLAAGGSEGDLMAVAGWSNRAMIDRYSASTAADRATAESRRLDLGNLG